MHVCKCHVKTNNLESEKNSGTHKFLRNFMFI